MRALVHRYWVACLIGAVLVFGIAVTVNIASEIGQPFGGFYANRVSSSSTWQVDAATPPWWPGLTQSQLRYDDQLVALEDGPYDAAAEQVYARVLNAGRQSVNLTILRGSTQLQLDIPIRIFSFSDFLDLKLPDLLIGLGFWLLAFAVYRVRPEETINRVFSIACSLTAGAIWLSIQALFPESDWFARLIQLGWVFNASFQGVAFIQLALSFPEPVRANSVRLLKILPVLMLFVVATYAASLFLRWQAGVPALSTLLGEWCNGAVITVFGLAALIYLARLIWLILQPGLSRRLRRQVWLLLVGLMLALPYILIVVLRALIHGTESYFWNNLDLRYLVLVVPLSFAFIILRYQTFQRTPPMLIGVLILASSALGASIGAWIMRLTEPAWVNGLNWPPFVPLFAAALIYSIFWSSQSSWWGAFSRLFQWERRSYGAVRQFGQQVVNEMDLTQLPGTIAVALVANMELERAAIWLWDEKAAAYHLAGKAGRWPQPPATPLIPAVVPTTVKSIRIDKNEMLPGWLAPLRGNDMIEAATPLAISGQPIGLLGSGKRWDEDILDERDLEVMELIAQQAGLFLLTALQIEQLRQVPQQITTAQERERFKIAQELHDTVQQFLGRLPFFLEVSRSAARSNPAETEAVLARCIADVENAAQTVRQIRNNLSPLQLERSLSQPLLLLIEGFGTRNHIETKLEMSSEVDAQLSAEARHALYRVVQQALDNVAAHAEAGHVTVALAEKDGRIQFTVTDDGRGSTDAQRARAGEQGSFGLKSMEARITSLGGEFAIRSAPAAGTTLSGWLPMLSPSG